MHFIWHRSVILRQIGMISARIYDNQGETTALKSIIYRLNDRLLRIGEVNCNQASISTCHLIEQTGRLVPIFILRILADFGQGDGI
ncbi:hypothetical protein D3C77_581580 [compost metagenome]